MYRVHATTAEQNSLFLDTKIIIQVTHQYVESLELSLESLSKLPDLFGFRQVKDVDVDLL